MQASLAVRKSPIDVLCGTPQMLGCAALVKDVSLKLKRTSRQRISGSLQFAYCAGCHPTLSRLLYFFLHQLHIPAPLYRELVNISEQRFRQGEPQIRFLKLRDEWSEASQELWSVRTHVRSLTLAIFTIYRFSRLVPLASGRDMQL
jgi:hypothetical protein